MAEVTTGQEASGGIPAAVAEGDGDEGATPLLPDFGVDGAAEVPPLVEVAELPIGIALMPPRPGVSDLQDGLVTANAVARADSLATLATWLPGYDFQDAARNVDGRRFSVLAIGNTLLDHLGSEEDICRVMFEQEHAWGVGGISFVHGDQKGHRGPPPYAARRPARSKDFGTLIPGGLARALHERWTAVINSAQNRYGPLADVCLHLTRAYGSPTNTNIYVSWGPAKGFGAHWDTHDTIIVPVCGHKRWALFEPSVLSAQRPWVEPECSDKPLWEGVLEPGMALVIPRGWGHRVDGSDDLSVHCTLGVNRLEVHNLLERVAFEAGWWPALRADVPYSVDDEVLSYAGSVFDSPQGFARTIAEVATPELVDRAIAAHRARLIKNVFSEFGGAFRAVAFDDWSEVTVRLQVPAGVMVQTEEADHVVMAFKDQAVKVAAEASDAFVALADCRPHLVSDLPPVGDGQDRREEFARQLVTNGLAIVERAPA